VRPFGHQLISCCRSSGPKLDSNLRLRFEPSLLYAVQQSKPIISWNGDETARELYDVEPYCATRVDVLCNGATALGEDTLDEPARRNENSMLMAQRNQRLELPSGHHP